MEVCKVEKYRPINVRDDNLTSGKKVSHWERKIAVCAQTLVHVFSLIVFKMPLLLQGSYIRQRIESGHK